MSRLIALLFLSVCLLSLAADVFASSDGERSEQRAPECPVINGQYKVYGQQLSGPDVGSKYGPSLTNHVFWPYQVDRPGVRSQGIKLKILDASRLAIVVLDSEQTVITEKELRGGCDGGWFVLSSMTTGGSEGYSGTTNQVIRLRASQNGSLVANVKTESKGRDFLIFPHSDSSERTFEFYRRDD